MKKLICLVLCLIIIAASMPAVFAASSVSAWASQVNAKKGDTVTVYVNLSTTETVKGLGVTVGYDSSVFEYVSYDWTVANNQELEGDTMKPFDPVTGSGAVLISPASKPNGEIFCITLRIKNDAPLGDSSVNFGVKVGSDGETVYANSTITVGCNHSWGSWKTISEATCTEIGQQERICSICGTRQQSYIDAKGHSYSDWQTTKEASCTEKGEQVRTCSVCGSSQARTVDPLGHTLGDDREVIKEATCTEHGEAKGTCTVCGQSVSISTPFAPHNYGDWYTIVQATCTEKGEREHECTVCGHVERQKSLPLGHDFSEGNEISKATIYSTGLFEAVCTRCGAAGTIISPCSFTDETTHIYLETEEDVFPLGSTVKVNQLSSVRPEEKEVKEGFEKYFDEIKEYFIALYDRVVSGKNKDTAEIKDHGMGSVSSAYDLYEIKAVNNDGDKVEQKGDVEITFPIPDGFGRNLAIYSIDDSGKRSELTVSVDMNERTVKATTSDLNMLALANLDSLPEKDELRMPAILRYIIEGLVLLLLLLFMILAGKRRRQIKALRKELGGDTQVKEKSKKKEEKKEKKEEVPAKEIPDEQGSKTEDTKEVSEEITETSSEDKPLEPLNNAPSEGTEVTRSVQGSLRDEIYKEIGGTQESTVRETETPAAEEKPEDKAPAKKKPTLDDIFGKN